MVDDPLGLQVGIKQRVAATLGDQLDHRITGFNVGQLLTGLAAIVHDVVRGDLHALTLGLLHQDQQFVAQLAHDLIGLVALTDGLGTGSGCCVLARTCGLAGSSFGVNLVNQTVFIANGQLIGVDVILVQHLGDDLLTLGLGLAGLAEGLEDGLFVAGVGITLAKELLERDFIGFAVQTHFIEIVLNGLAGHVLDAVLPLVGVIGHPVVQGFSVQRVRIFDAELGLGHTADQLLGILHAVDVGTGKLGHALQAGLHHGAERGAALGFLGGLFGGLPVLFGRCLAFGFGVGGHVISGGLCLGVSPLAVTDHPQLALGVVDAGQQLVGFLVITCGDSGLGFALQLVTLAKDDLASQTGVSQRKQLVILRVFWVGNRKIVFDAGQVFIELGSDALGLGHLRLHHKVGRRLGLGAGTLGCIRAKVGLAHVFVERLAVNRPELGVGDGLEAVTGDVEDLVGSQPLTQHGLNGLVGSLDTGARSQQANQPTHTRP